MPYVVTAPCDGCKYTDCVTVCPCECFREGETMLYIDPELCIDCEACVPECPVEAIYPDHAVPAEWEHFVKLNAEMSRKTPPILTKKSPLIGPTGESSAGEDQSQ
ncbi:ferredoxin family protein [Blastopirellula marina]|uniref:Ferredoxin n=1 Tax=Blastopirellula marina TaxID=124 RepID=A0A2S8GER8_9BACT|nr:4Fe-4S binding protein [Blastopirellula marina]PQO42594.1 ferredoxin [Blastopirellula marina]PTL46360.1 ferredoxin [Blastopirellula marina]